ncbi:MAG: hypothetical protein SRB1_03038 [Desulfobacteraceae bacterium Eth-SRB1]|nr:MAG: hypothetical protein SRB1_03038 [Desulfobacteraceae bacterium Eth-SRB1]
MKYRELTEKIVGCAYKVYNRKDFDEDLQDEF